MMVNFRAMAKVPREGRYPTVRLITPSDVDTTLTGSYLSQVCEAVVVGDGVSDARSSVDLDRPLVEIEARIAGAQQPEQPAERHQPAGATTSHGRRRRRGTAAAATAAARAEQVRRRRPHSDGAGVSR